MKSFIRITSSLSFLKEENMLLYQSKQEVKTVKLEPQLSDLFVQLIQLKNQVITKEDLIEAVWNGNGYVGNEALRKNIYKLRSLIAKVDIKSELSIVTIPKTGYKLQVQEAKSKLKKRKVYQLFSYAAASAIVLFFVLMFSTNETVDHKKYADTKQELVEENEEIILVNED